MNWMRKEIYKLWDENITHTRNFCCEVSHSPKRASEYSGNRLPRTFCTIFESVYDLITKYIVKKYLTSCKFFLKYKKLLKVEKYKLNEGEILCSI